MWTSQLSELFNQIGPPSSLPIRVFSCQCVPDFKINFDDLAKCNRTNSIMPKKTQIVIQLIDRGTFFRWIHNSHWTGQLHKVSFNQTVFVFSQEKYKSQVAFLPGFLSINPLGSCDLGKLLFLGVSSMIIGSIPCFKLCERGSRGRPFMWHQSRRRRKAVTLCPSHPPTTATNFFSHSGEIFMKHTERDHTSETWPLSKECIWKRVNLKF